MNRAYLLKELGTLAGSLAKIAAALSNETPEDHDDLIPFALAAQIAVVSTRTLSDAVRGEELVAFGKQRNRCIRRRDLTAWIESRRVRPIDGPRSPDLDRRIAQLESARRARKAAAK